MAQRNSRLPDEHNTTSTLELTSFYHALLILSSSRRRVSALKRPSRRVSADTAHRRPPGPSPAPRRWAPGCRSRAWPPWRPPWRWEKRGPSPGPSLRGLQRCRPPGRSPRAGGVHQRGRRSRDTSTPRRPPICGSPRVRPFTTTRPAVRAPMARAPPSTPLKAGEKPRLLVVENHRIAGCQNLVHPVRRGFGG